MVGSKMGPISLGAIRERRAEKMLRFAKRQATERQWIRLSEIADHYGRERSAAAGYAALQASILADQFVERGRSRLLYLHPWSTMAKMTSGKMRTLIEVYSNPEILTRHYVGCCWMPIDMAIKWCAQHRVRTTGWLVGRRRRGGRTKIDDDRPLAEMKALMAGGMPTLQAAQQVAPKAAGHSLEAKIERLRRKARRIKPT
jgi:hypothetical protein